MITFQVLKNFSLQSSKTSSLSSRKLTPRRESSLKTQRTRYLLFLPLVHTLNNLRAESCDWSYRYKKHWWPEEKQSFGPAGVSEKPSPPTSPGISSPGCVAKSNWSFHGNLSPQWPRCACGSSRCVPSARWADGRDLLRQTGSRTKWRWPARGTVWPLLSALLSALWPRGASAVRPNDAALELSIHSAGMSLRLKVLLDNLPANCPPAHGNQIGISHTVAVGRKHLIRSPKSSGTSLHHYQTAQPEPSRYA